MWNMVNIIPARHHSVNTEMFCSHLDQYYSFPGKAKKAIEGVFVANELLVPLMQSVFAHIYSKRVLHIRAFHWQHAAAFRSILYDNSAIDPAAGVQRCFFCFFFKDTTVNVTKAKRFPAWLGSQWRVWTHAVMCTTESTLHSSTSNQTFSNMKHFSGTWVTQGSRDIEAALFPTGHSCH